MVRTNFMLCLAAAAASLAADAGTAQVVLVNQFSPGLGTLVSCGVDHTTGTVWVYDDFASTMSSYTSAGVLLNSIPAPGEDANDVDIEFAPEPLALGSTAIAEGTLLFINGESGVAEIYAVDTSTGAVITTLTTAFGVSHVVGGAYHARRHTFFLVQDKVPGGTNANRIAEINPATGAVINSFQTTGVFSVNFGDLDINSDTGNLLLVSSDESTIGEFTPTGTLVQNLAFPGGVSSISGIGMDDITGEAWVSGTGGTMWRLGGLPKIGLSGDITGNGVVDVDDLLEVINAWGDCPPPRKADCPADIAPPPNGNGTVDVDDLLVVINNWG